MGDLEQLANEIQSSSARNRRRAKRSPNTALISEAVDSVSRETPEDTRGCDWSPRDVLVAMLAEIDSGRVDPDALVVCFRHGNHGAGTGFFASAADVVTMLGVVESVKLLIHEAGKPS